MGRLVGVATALTLLASALPARSAELTRVASSGDPDNPFDIDLSLRWERLQKRGRVSREVVTGAPGGLASVEDKTELRVNDITNVVIPRVAVGLYQDLELHFELPYLLAREDAWRYGQVDGLSVAGTSTIATNTINPDGISCVTPSSPTCPIFPVGPTGTTLFQGGVAGDLKAGLTWGVFSDRRDDTKPFWLVGIDITFPSAKLYDPAAGRGSTWLTPFAVASKTGPWGQKIWKYDLYTALSRRMGPIDPYFKAHVTAMQKSSSTYSNCDQVAAALANGQASQAAVDNCALPRWKDDAAARLPYVAGLTFGAELIPYEDSVAGQKVAIDLRVAADYTSSSRWYNELTDATGRLLHTDSSVTVLGSLGILFRASEFVALQGTASLGTTTGHYLTGEGLGANGGPDQNPNFDWRYDAPGRRFRLDDVTLFNLQIAGILQF